MKKVIVLVVIAVVLAGCAQVLNPAGSPDARSLQALGGVNGPGQSVKADKLRADPFVYDPDKTGIIVSAWVPGTGLPDAGDSDHGLVLQKNGPTTTNAAAGAVISGADGTTLTELGFDYNGYCGAGSPRFNVEIGGKLFFFGCAYGTHTPLANGWMRVRFGDADAFPQLGGAPGGAFGGTIESVDIVADEEGQTVIDNIDVNGTLIGKPGNAD